LTVATSGFVFHDRAQLVPLTFMQDDVAASQSDVQLTIVQEDDAGANQSIAGYVMPWSGTIVGISAALSAAATAGTLTVGATVAGTEAADPTLSITTEVAKSDTAARGVATFAAGDLIGCEITTGGTWDGTSSDLGVVVWVLLDVTGI
jgi:hypothetical protein